MIDGFVYVLLEDVDTIHYICSVTKDFKKNQGVAEAVEGSETPSLHFSVVRGIQTS